MERSKRRADGISGDLYLVDGNNGDATWRYNLDNPPTGIPRILGYEEGVDLVPWCNTVEAPVDLVAVPTEDGCGADSDLLLVDLSTGHFHRSLEAQNPPLRMIGYEKGVDPLFWIPTVLLVPVDDERGGTCYDIATGQASNLRPDSGFSSVSCLANDVPDAPYTDARIPLVAQSYYYLVRAQNLCGVGTYGDSNVLPDPRDALDGALDPCP